MDSKRQIAVRNLILASILWSMGGIAALTIYIYLRRPRIRFSKIKWYGAICYSVLGILFVVANKLTTSANAILLQFTAPVWVAIISQWVLKKPIRQSDWLAVFIVLAGMTLFFVGDLEVGNMIGNFIAVLSGIAMAGLAILLKMQAENEAVEVTLLGSVVTFLVCLPFILGQMPSLYQLFLLLILGVFQIGVAYILYSFAIAYVSFLEAVL